MKMMETMDQLGGAGALGAAVGSELEFIRMVEEGLPIAAAEHLSALGELSEAELGEIVPRRTLSHARAKGRLSPEQSDRVVRAIGLYARAHEVFANREKANRWMRRPNRALDGERPLALLRTSSGSELVETLLERIAYGVYS
jgi:putative toxin-antitoxin system antitoxin component (TIGR02293 family)